MTDEICNLSLSSVCRLQEIFLFILSYYFARKRSCNVQLQKISIPLTESNQGSIDVASIIFGIIRHYEHTFQCMYFPKKALLAQFALSASFAAQNCHLLIIQPINKFYQQIRLVWHSWDLGPKGRNLGTFHWTQCMRITDQLGYLYGYLTWRPSAGFLFELSQFSVSELCTLNIHNIYT